jgi:hypothetical protein
MNRKSRFFAPKKQLISAKFRPKKIADFILRAKKTADRTEFFSGAAVNGPPTSLLYIFTGN